MTNVLTGEFLKQAIGKPQMEEVLGSGSGMVAFNSAAAPSQTQSITAAPAPDAYNFG